MPPTSMRTKLSAGIVTAAAAVSLVACGSSSSGTTKSSKSNTASKSTANGGSSTNGAPSGAKPTGTKPSSKPGKGGTAGKGGNAPTGGEPGGSGGAPHANSTSIITGTGSLTVGGTTRTKTGGTITATRKNESGVLVKKSGKLTMSEVAVETTGASSSSDASSFYGLDAGVLDLSGTLTETDGLVTTSGAGANDVFACGTSSTISISGTTIKATGQYAHGIMASGGGKITATNLTVSTKGASSADVATDRGGGTMNVNGGTYTSSGHDSPGIYSTGTITANNATFDATGAEAAVVEGDNTISVSKSHLTGRVNRGVMIYQSMSGDASGSIGTFTETGGSLTAKSGPLFYITNATGRITLAKVALSVTSGVLLDAAAGQWGTSGSNGGHVVLNAYTQTLKGAVMVDKRSTAVLDLRDSALTGAVDHANTAKKVTVALSGTSTWTVTATSHVTVFSGLTISGSTATNIVGNGHNVYYSKTANPSLNGKTYTLTQGGHLIAE